MEVENDSFLRWLYNDESSGYMCSMGYIAALAESELFP